MSSFEEIKIVGIDPERQPRVRKESYIDLFFRLSTKAPDDWGEEFNALGRQLNPAAKVDKTNNMCIETYVNDMNNIQRHLNEIKQAVQDCNAKHVAKIEKRAADLAASQAALQGEDGAQHHLNQIIAALDFESKA